MALEWLLNSILKNLSKRSLFTNPVTYGRHACMITDSVLTMRIPSDTGTLTTVPAESPFLSFHPSTQTHQIHLHFRLKTMTSMTPSCWCLTCCYSWLFYAQIRMRMRKTDQKFSKSGVGIKVHCFIYSTSVNWKERV